MRIICISDTHARHRQARLPEGDLLLHAGDISNGSASQIEDFIEWLGEQPHRHKVFIAGNMDRSLETQPNRFRSLLPENVHYLENEWVEIEGLCIWGSPVIPDFVGAFNRKRGTDIRAYWNLMPARIDILLTHTPPYGILDRTSLGLSVGCEELLEKVSEVRPRLHLFGHVHEACGRLEKNGTTFVNASFVGGFLQANKPPVVVEW